jgi:uncharacterized metal-binding protein
MFLLLYFALAVLANVVSYVLMLALRAEASVSNLESQFVLSVEISIEYIADYCWHLGYYFVGLVFVIGEYVHVRFLWSFGCLFLNTPSF